MPQIPIGEARYDDDLKKIIDTYNENFRLIWWLINTGKINSDNIQSVDLSKLAEALNGLAPIDKYGINPDFIKRYPNKCWNSSFEVFDPASMKPAYWSGGVSSPNAVWDGGYSLKLAPGQIVFQEEVNGKGFANSDWWANGQTRISFKMKGNTYIYVRVKRASNGSLYTIWDNDGRSGSQLLFGPAPDWPDGYCTFAFQPSPGDGKFKLEFENAGTADVYIDAVQIEPDFTGKWPSLYTHGPESIEEVKGLCAGYVTYTGTADATLTIYFDYIFSLEPVLFCSLVFDGTYTNTENILLTPSHIVSNGKYNGATIKVKRSAADLKTFKVSVLAVGT